jgi:hypothetical protein
MEQSSENDTKIIKNWNFGEYIWMKLQLWKNLEGKYEILHLHWEKNIKKKKRT